MTTAAEIEDAIRALAHARGPQKSFCPSEAARRLDPSGWRDLMPRILQVAASMPDIVATQKGASLHPAEAKGPIRLRLGQNALTK